MTRAVAVVALTVLLAPGPEAEMPVPVEQQLSILLKTLTFDRRLPARAPDELVIGVLYQRKYRVSLVAHEQLVAAFSPEAARVILGRPVRLVGIEADGDEWAALVIGVHVLYVTPLRALSVDAVVAKSRGVKVLTMTGVPEYVDGGIALGIGRKGDRPAILVNLAAARAEGSDFNSQLLRLARVVQ